MKKNYTLLGLIILFSGITFAQEAQKNFINYQGVARNSSNELMTDEALTIGVALKFGAANGVPMYEESHAVTTDANGVFSLLIGNGSPVNGNYNTLPWGSSGTFITVAMNGNEVGTTEMMAVPYAISSGDADDQSAAEVLYDNSVSGLSATTTQEAIDELITRGSVDADADPSNEFQLLSFDAGASELSLSDGNTIIIPTGGTDADADPTNEIQTISFDTGTNELSLSDGGVVIIPSSGTDADADPANEFQTLNFDAGTNELSLSDGNTVTIPSGGTDADADPENEIDVTRRRGLLVGDDGIVDGLIGTADGQVAKWDAALGNWVAGTDQTGGAGGSSLWLENGDDINFDTGKVGIGVTSPFGKLQVSQNSGGFPFLVLETTSGSTSNIRFSKNGVNESWDQIATIAAGDEALNTFNYSFYDGGTAHNVMTLQGNRRMGVNNSNPQTALDVGGQIRSNALSGGGNVVADVDGNLVIGAGGGGSSLWNENGGHINYDTGRVGIGTGANVPVTRVEISGIPGVSEEVGFTNALFTITDNEFGGGPYRMIMGGSSIQTTAEGALSSLRLNPEGGDILTGSGNVGIGVSPTEKLDVNGTMRSRDLEGTGQRNVMADADGNLVIGAGAGGSSIWETDANGINFSSGNIGIGGSSSTFPLNISTDNGRSINLSSSNTDNYIAFNNDSGYKGYAGIFNGDSDMDIGTGFGNLIGKVHLVTGSFPQLTVATNGDVGIGTTTPSAKLEVVGDIKISGEVHGPDTGAVNMIPIAYGSIGSSGVQLPDSGSGNFSVNRTGVGEYRIVISGEDFSFATCTAQVSRIDYIGQPGFIGMGSSVSSLGERALRVNIFNMSGLEEDSDFTFLIFKP